MSYKKVGGLHFVRVWRLSFSFCLCKAKPKASRTQRPPVRVVEARSYPAGSTVVVYNDR
jgi:hypothetical protein